MRSHPRGGTDEAGPAARGGILARSMIRTASLLVLLALPLVACAGPGAGARGVAPVDPGGRLGVWETIGESGQGRAVRAMDLGRGGPRVAVIAGIHGDEQEGLRHLDEVVELLAEVPWRVRLVEDACPDGTAARSRTTPDGVDPNRNWPASNFEASARCGPRPLSEPSVAAVHRELLRFEPELVVVLHSARSGPFVNYDGPAAAYAERFRRGAGSGWRVQPSMGYPTPGSLGTWMGVDRGVPILTIEFARGSEAAATGPALLGGLGELLGAGVARAEAERPRSEFVVR